MATESIQITIANVTIDYEEPAKKDIKSIIRERSSKRIETITHFGNNGKILAINLED